MSEELTTAHIEQGRLALDFLEEARKTGTWLPIPSTNNQEEIEFSFFTYHIPYGERVLLNDEAVNKLLVERFKAAARAISTVLVAYSAVGGRWLKNDPKASNYDDTYYIFTNAVKVGSAEVKLRMQRDTICERVKVGTKTEKVKKVVQEAVTEEVEETVDIYERECKPLFRNTEAELENAMRELDEGVLEGELIP